MELSEIYEKLKSKFGEEKIIEFVVTGDEKKGLRDPFILVQAESLAEICQSMRDEDEFHFEMLHCISAVEWPEYFESVYHLYSMKNRQWAVLKVRVSKEEPRVPSVASLWETANWLERECYDLMGVEYEGHPDLNRILLHENWEGHPLRKDYEMPTHERLQELGF